MVLASFFGIFLIAMTIVSLDHTKKFRISQNYVAYYLIYILLDI